MPSALVTGGSRGVGAATAILLAQAGYEVVLTYNNKARRADEVASLIRQRGGRVLTVQCDITSVEDRRRLVEAVRSWTPSLDFLVLNASGGLERRRLLENADFPMLINRDAQVGLVQDLDVGGLVTVHDMAAAIVDAARDPRLPSGHVVVVGGPLEQLLPA